MVYARHKNHNQIFIESEILSALWDTKAWRGFLNSNDVLLYKLMKKEENLKISQIEPFSIESKFGKSFNDPINKPWARSCKINSYEFDSI